MKSVVILKDATATAIYGSRGANGVILIQTKSGTNFSLIPRYDVMRNPDLFIETAWNAQKNSGEKNGVPDPITFANNNLFAGTSSIDQKYNLWQGVTTGADLIDPATGKVKAGISRKYNPENWEEESFQSAIRNEATVIMKEVVTKADTTHP
jgi:TonB-dependent SusC/RagA subfamily outer membrane receptor